MPDGWTLERVGDTGTVHAGRQRSPHFKDGEIRPYLRVANVFDGYIDISDVNQMAFTDEAFERYLLHPGDILLNEGQSIELVGRVAMYQGEPPDCCFQNTLVRYQAGPTVDNYYALALFQYCQHNGLFSRIATRTNSIAHLGVSRFADLALPFPPLPEQRKIAKILSTWDRAIEMTEALLATARTQKRALMQSLLTGKRRFPEFEGEEWKEVRLGGLGAFKKGKGLPKAEVGAIGRFPCVLYGELYTKYGEIIREPRSRTDLDDGVISSPGDVLIPASTTTSGIDLAIAACVTDGGVRLGGDINIFRRNTDEIDGAFLAYFLTHARRHEMARFAQGITIVHLKGSDLLDIKILVPPRTEQTKLMSLVQDVEAEIEYLVRQIEKLRTEKKALMQQLLTGKRRVLV